MGIFLLSKTDLARIEEVRQYAENNHYKSDEWNKRVPSGTIERHMFSINEEVLWPYGFI
jgi:hypothetical protein